MENLLSDSRYVHKVNQVTFSRIQANRLDLCCCVEMVLPSKGLSDEEESGPESESLGKRRKNKSKFDFSFYSSTINQSGSDLKLSEISLRRLQQSVGFGLTTLDLVNIYTIGIHILFSSSYFQIFCYNFETSFGRLVLIVPTSRGNEKPWRYLRNKVKASSVHVNYPINSSLTRFFFTLRCMGKRQI